MSVGAGRSHPRKALADRLEARVEARWAEIEGDARADELTDRYRRDHPELVAAAGSSKWVSTMAALDHVDGRSVPLERDAVARAHARTVASAWLASAWPPAAVRLAVETVAGADGGRRAAFESQVLAFGDAWAATHRAAMLEGRVYDGAHILALPDFAFVEPTGPPRSLLLGWCVFVATAPGLLLALGAWRRLGRTPAIVGT